MSHGGFLSGRRAALAVPVAVGLLSIGSLVTTNAVPASATSREAQGSSFKVCMGTGGQTLSWETGQGQNPAIDRQKRGLAVRHSEQQQFCRHRFGERPDVRPRQVQRHCGIQRPALCKPCHGETHNCGPHSDDHL